MASARVVIPLLCALLSFSSASMASPDEAADQASEQHYSELRQLDQQIQNLKKSALGLEMDIHQVENQVMFPANQQLRIFLTMEVFDFELSSIQVSANGTKLSQHNYTPREVYALRKGGVQDLYLGNISPGVHNLQARFIGKFEKSADQAPYEKTIEVSFRKGDTPQWLELRIDRSNQQQLGLRVFQREPSE